MEQLAEFFVRLIGPVAFSLAIMLMLIYYTQITNLQEAIYQQSTEQAVVSQMLPDKSGDTLVSYSSLIGRLIGGVTEDTMISITDKMVRVLIQVDEENYEVTVMEADNVVYAEKCRRLDWNKVEFPYDYIDNATYRVIETYYDSGALKTVTYVKVV